MICPNCKTENSDANRFCLICGEKLPQEPATQESRPIASYPPAALESQPVAPYPVTQRSPKDPVSQIALIFGIIGVAGGALTVLGWLIPWFGLGGLADAALNLLGIGSKSRLLGFGSGVGSGLQLSLFLLLASFAAFSSNDTVLLGLLGLVTILAL
jgi:hypothetical protein